MTKKGLLVGALAVVVAGGVFAVDWKAYPAPLKKGNVIINAGIGFGTPLYGDMIIPPIVASLDYVLPLGKMPFTLGLLGGYTTSGNEIGAGDYKTTYTYSGTAIAGRLGYHPNFGFKKTDIYANLALGYYIYKGEVKAKMGDQETSASADHSQFYYGFNLGARYFFTPKVGGFVELGYSALTVASAGLTFKF